MKKFFKILIINLFIIILLIISGEALSFYLLTKEDPNFHYLFIEKKFEDRYADGDFLKEFRPTEIGTKKGTILLFGCCMTYGVYVDRTETLSHILNKYTGMTIINRGYPGWALSQMYYQLTNPNFKQEVKEKPDYIVYTIIRDHYRRIFSNSSANEPYYLTYKIKNGKLVKNTNAILNRSLIVYLAKSLYCKNSYNKNLVEYYLVESYKKAQELYPGVKFIVLDIDRIVELYDDKNCSNNEFLRQNNIKIINASKYTDDKSLWEMGKDYWCDDFGHPSGKYWNKIIPHIVKEFG